MTNSFSEYLEEVFKKLEYMNYPELVEIFDSESVAKSIVGSCRQFYEINLSPYKAALVVFGLTWEYQILPLKSSKSNITIH